MTMANIQYQLSNAEWVDASPEQVERFIGRLLARETETAPRLKRPALTSREQVLARLEAGEVLRHGDDWYQLIRAEPAPLPEVEPDLVRCACGHECERILVMSASLGTSCPDCYDRMSN
jgi:hypothetical protein